VGQGIETDKHKGARKNQEKKKKERILEDETTLSGISKKKKRGCSRMEGIKKKRGGKEKKAFAQQNYRRSSTREKPVGNGTGKGTSKSITWGEGGKLEDRKKKKRCRG